MKTRLLFLAAVVSGANAFAQGTIDFMNRNIPGANGAASYNIPIWISPLHGPSGTGAGITPGGITVGLFEAGATVPLVTTQLRSDTAANAAFFATATQTATTSSPVGSTPVLFVRAWTTASGSYAAAKADFVNGQWGEWAFTSQPLGGTPAGGGLPIPTPGMTGWGPGFDSGGFTLAPIPEPSTVALGVLGVGALILGRTFFQLKNVRKHGVD